MYYKLFQKRLIELTMIKIYFLFLISILLGLFFSVYQLYVDKEYSLDFIGLIKDTLKQQLRLIEVDTLIKAHNNEKIILKFLIFFNHFHRIICKEIYELDKFLDTATDSAKRLNCPSEKIFFLKSIVFLKKFSKEN